jgi:hypothetical protein
MDRYHQFDVVIAAERYRHGLVYRDITGSRRNQRFCTAALFVGAVKLLCNDCSILVGHTDAQIRNAIGFNHCQIDN